MKSPTKETNTKKIFFRKDERTNFSENEPKIYDCLKNIGLSTDEQIKMTKFATDEQRLADAVEFALRDDFEPVNLMAVITDNYKNKRKAIKAKNWETQNKAFSARFVPLANKILNKFAGTRLEACMSYLELIPGGQGASECFDWESVDFIIKVRRYFKKKNIWTDEMDALANEYLS